MRRLALAAILLSALLGTLQTAVPAGRAAPDREPPLPARFTIVFTMGYGGDLLPQEPAAFDALMAKVAAGGFTTVLASYEPWRLPILERHGLDLMVDLLDERYHVYRKPAEAEKVVRSLRGERTVWGYHLFSDTTSDVVAGRDRDARLVHSWDPTHPTFVGYKREVRGAADDLTVPDAIGFYNYHWVRDRSVHFHDLAFFGAQADRQAAMLYRWVWVQSGRAGIGNPNRNRYTVTTSMAFGLKGFLWFIGQQMIDPATWEWNAFGRDVIATNQELRQVGAAMMPLRRRATYSTATTRTMNDDPKDPSEPAIPPPLEAVPADAGFQVQAGEAVVGMFDDPEGRRVLVLANHNAYQPQSMRLRVDDPRAVVERFERATGEWLSLAAPDGVAAWTLDAGYADLVRYGGAVAPTETPSTAPTPTAAPSIAPSLTEAPPTETAPPSARPDPLFLPRVEQHRP